VLNNQVAKRLWDYLGQHPEQVFVLKALGLVALINIFKDVFYLWWLTILLFSPVFIWQLLRISSIHQDKGMVQILFENLTFIPAPYLDQDKNQKFIPWVTYVLILTNVFIFYLVMPTLSETTVDNLLFVPADPTVVKTLISEVSSMFLHADGWHLWGNMAFLWAIGTAVEMRIGHGWLIGLYLATGLAGNLLFAVVGSLVYGTLPQVLGASGAISGLMGVYAIRCYFKTMVFPFPVLGFFAFLFPINLKVRMNALVVMGLFFWADLSSGMDEIAGIREDNVAYWCHLGGMLAGILLALRMKLGDEALQEKRFDTARLAFGGKNYLGEEAGEKALRAYLSHQEDDVEAMLMLAKYLSRHRLSEEGRDLYQKAVILLLDSDLSRALVVYREYVNRYLKPLRPDLQFRMAVLAERAGDIHFASRSLEMLLGAGIANRELQEKCLFHCVRLCKKLGLPEATAMYEEELRLCKASP
jgi:membrane associated rhomboid family serine protease